MSTRTTLRPTPVIVNGDMSQATIASEATILQSLTMVSYEVSWTGSTPIGILELQVSNTYALNAVGGVENSGIWTSMPLDIQGNEVMSIPITGNTDNGFIDATLPGGYAIRLLYTKTSGSGTFNATINGKVS